MKKNIYFFSPTCWAICILLLFTCKLYAQPTKGFVVSGVVTDLATNAPMADVSVNIKGGRTGTTTDINGKYTITSKDGKFTLVFSYAGYANKEVAVNNKAKINTALEAENKNLDDVVVIGYQAIKRRDVLASVSSVSAKDLKDIPLNSAAEALAGRLAGVQVTTAEGSPDADIKIRVRGGGSITQDNSPIYIIDGVQVENALNTISPQDIQTIDVLKDAAATAIYGARGANGVVIITTKTGKPGKLNVNFNSFAGVRFLPKTLDVLDPYDFVVYAYERSRGNPMDSANFAKRYGSTWDTLQVYKNVKKINWQDEVLGQTGFSNTNNISIGGGNKKTTFNLSYTNNYEKAIVVFSKYQRNLINLKADHKITKKIKLGVSARYNNQEVEGAGTSDDKGSSYNRLRNAVKYVPFLTNGSDLDDVDPSIIDNPGNGLNLVNPVALAKAEYRKKSTNAFNGSASFSYAITKQLSFKSTFGYDYNHFIDRQFSDSITPFAVIQGAAKPVVGLDTTNKTTINNSNVFIWSKKGIREKHDVDVLIGEETYQFHTDIYSNLFKGFPTYTEPSKAFSQTSLATPFATYPRVTKYEERSLSFFTRVSYAYKSKYLFSANLRADASSKFREDLRWGYFPSGSLAWRVSKENFLKDANWLSDLKLRIGYGQVGNNRIADYLYIPTFNNNTYIYGLNNVGNAVYSSAGLVNELLKWETATSRNIGLDVSFLKDRLQLSVDYYRNTTKDLLINTPIAPTYGYTSQLQNVGSTSNKGLEIQLNAIPVKNKNFSWSTNFNIAFNTNKIESISQYQKSFLQLGYSGVSGQPLDYIVKVGEPVGSFYGLVTDGFYKVSDFDYNATTKTYTLKAGITTDAGIVGTPQPGTIRFADLNNDGKIDLDNDRTIIGNANPKFIGGLNQQFTYKGWDASVFINFTYGNDIFNANKLEFTNGYTNNSNLLSIEKDRWKTVNAQGVIVTDPTELTALNADAKLWQPIRAGGAFFLHSWAIEDGSFLRINNVSLGYSIKSPGLKKAKISKLRFYATASNIAVFTSYTGYDPDVNVRSKNPLTPGLDYSAYPKSRSYILGVNVSFN